MAFLNASTASSGDRNLWPHSLFLTFGKVKKSLGLRSGLLVYGGWSNNSTFSSVKYCLVF
ncbi:unnamed protein product [Acanthoscelides obtectus]|uniref:Uncharacterized protein n=1 Tax=Acanthoscelides obtectus TaxID=200917 RepID=A0A9P0PSK8_ACAOB|nr:unnamed protein product [Acanthoscelides obtectus]CAK1669866.1 hypothetical protein AOBTE_LOCUS27281 [Acanthoscelides obtectus]